MKKEKSFPAFSGYFYCFHFILLIFLCLQVEAGSDSEDEKEQCTPLAGRYLGKKQISPDVASISQDDCNQKLNGLRGMEKPIARAGEVYLGESSCRTITPGTLPTGAAVAFVGEKHANYIQSSSSPQMGAYREYFSVPQRKDSKIGREKEYKRPQKKFKYTEKYSLKSKSLISGSEEDATLDTIGFDVGHGIDHAHTLTHKGSNSTRHPLNLTPQNSYYNQRIRNPLVQKFQKENRSFKEIPIYPEKPLMIKRKETTDPLPEGFLFLVLNRSDGSIVKSYYFPNLHQYKKGNYKKVAAQYEISTEIAMSIYKPDIISDEEKRRLAQWKSEHVGYRSLSGRFEVLPEKGPWPARARQALTRTAAIYRMQRAAEYDLTVENMLNVAQLFNDEVFYYYEPYPYKWTLYNPDLAQYWTKRAIEEIKRKGYTEEDVEYWKNYKPDLPIIEDVSDFQKLLQEKIKETGDDSPIKRKATEWEDDLFDEEMERKKRFKEEDNEEESPSGTIFLIPMEDYLRIVTKSRDTP